MCNSLIHSVITVCARRLVTVWDGIFLDRPRLTSVHVRTCSRLGRPREKIPQKLIYTKFYEIRRLYNELVVHNVPSKNLGVEVPWPPYYFLKFSQYVQNLYIIVHGVCCINVLIQGPEVYLFNCFMHIMLTIVGHSEEARKIQCDPTFGVSLALQFFSYQVFSVQFRPENCLTYTNLSRRSW